MNKYTNLVADAISQGVAHPEIDEIRKICDLIITTGNIVICDPLVFPDSEQLSQEFPIGKFPVYLYFQSEEHHHALSEIRFSENQVIKWQLAVVEGQNPDELDEGEIFGYPVDSGLGCFMDVESRNIMLEHENELEKQKGEEYISYYDDYMADFLELDDFCSLQPDPDKENNIAVFQTGYGDGFYGSYIGYDADGNPARLVTDFALIGSEE